MKARPRDEVSFTKSIVDGSCRGNGRPGLEMRLSAAQQ